MNSLSGHAPPERTLQVAGRVVAAAWIVAVVVASIQVASVRHDNLEIFRAAFHNLVADVNLYRLHPEQRDFFLYTPTFALLYAPFALVPFWAATLLWSAVNAGALYWGLGRLLSGPALLAARALVFLEVVGSMQNAQSNALVTGLMLIGCGELDRRRESRAAVAIMTAAAIKIFPALAGLYAIFRPYRLPRYAGLAIAAGLALLLLPLLATPPETLVAQYRGWLALHDAEATMRGESLMQQLHLWLGWNGPNWPIQLAGLALLVAPLLRVQFWGRARFRLLALASLLMFCVLFNHATESATYIVAITGVALWFVHAPRTPTTRITLGVVFGFTVLATSSAMPAAIQEAFFDPYGLKILPILLVWVLTQVELWRQSAPAGSPAPPASA